MKRGHARRANLPWFWPANPFEIVLVEPEIPPNTGKIARICAATGTRLHLVEPLGFRIDDAALRRAGLDYWDAVDLHVHSSFDAFLRDAAPRRLLLFSTRGTLRYTDAKYEPGDALVFGRESRGLPDALLDAHPGRVLGIPIREGRVRSLNLSSAAAIALYEALRQANAPARIRKSPRD